MWEELPRVQVALSYTCLVEKAIAKGDPLFVAYLAFPFAMAADSFADIKISVFWPPLSSIESQWFFCNPQVFSTTLVLMKLQAL